MLLMLTFPYISYQFSPLWDLVLRTPSMRSQTLNVLGDARFAVLLERPDGEKTVLFVVRDLHARGRAAR